MNRTVTAIIAISLICAIGAAVYLILNGQQDRGNNDQGDASDPEVLTMDIKLTVDGRTVNVIWEDNPSVDAVKTLAKNGLTIDMVRYGGFEQTGQIGTSIVRNDSSMDVGSGDIVLYNGKQICLYFNDNSYSFTRLGKITGMTESEITEMLDRPSVTAVFTLV